MNNEKLEYDGLECPGQYATNGQSINTAIGARAFSFVDDGTGRNLVSLTTEARPSPLGPLVFHSLDLSPAAARHLADVLNRAADEAERSGWSATENGGNHDDGGTD